MIDSLIQKIIVRFRILKNYLNFKSKARSNSFDANRPTVFFEFTDIKQEPYYYPVIFSFHEAGYNIEIADHLKFIGHAFGPAKYIYDLPRIFIKRRPSNGVKIFVTDRESAFRQAHSISKKVKLAARAFEIKNRKVKYLPYPMHPNAYHYSYYKKVNQFRKLIRSCRILFSGNTDPDAYQNPIITQKFQKLNRIEIIQQLLSSLPPENKIIVEQKEDSNKIGNDYFNGAVFYLWQWSPIKSKGLDIRVPNNEWHQFLSLGDFFLCCPGVVIPQSHNAIEAMAVGTIPILQYPEYFHPMLEDGLNCIVFSNEEDLISKVKFCFSMSKAEIEKLRREVINYYDKWLKHDVPRRLIEDLADGRHDVYFYNEA